METMAGVLNLEETKDLTDSAKLDILISLAKKVKAR